MTVLTPSSPAWLAAVLNNFDTFLLDHAANERKASSMAMSMVAHYPDRTELTRALIDLARDTVARQTGHELVTEISFVGDFS